MFKDDGQMDWGEGAALGAGLGIGGAALAAHPLARKGLRAAAQWGSHGMDGGMRAAMGKMAGGAEKASLQTGRGIDVAAGRMGGGLRRQLGQTGDMAETAIAENPMMKLKQIRQSGGEGEGIADMIEEVAARLARGDKNARQIFAQISENYPEAAPLIKDLATHFKGDAKMSAAVANMGMAGAAGAGAVGLGAGLMGE